MLPQKFFLLYFLANSSNKGPVDAYLQWAINMVVISGLPN